MDDGGRNVEPHALAVILFAHALQPLGMRHATTPSGHCHFWFELEQDVPHLDLLVTLERPSRGHALSQGSVKAFFAKLAGALPDDWGARWDTAIAATDCLNAAGVLADDVADQLCPYG